MSQIDLFKVKKLEKAPNHNFTKHEVLWAILKPIKIRDQGMELGFFVLCFWICMWGSGGDFMVGFLRFQIWHFLSRVYKFTFWRANF